MFQENSKFKIDWQGPQSHSLEGGAGGWAQGPGSPAQATGGAGEMTCPLTTWGLHLPVAPTPAGQGPGVVTLTVAFSGRSPWTGQASRGEAQRQRAGLGFAASALWVGQPPGLAGLRQWRLSCGGQRAQLVWNEQPG